MARGAARFLLQILLAVLIGYWAIFVGYTVFRYFHGGTSAVVAWYRHINGDRVASTPGELAIPVWEPMRFAVSQLFIAVLTLLVWVGWKRLGLKPRSSA